MVVQTRGSPADSEVAAVLLDVQLRAGREDLAQDAVKATGPVYSLPETLGSSGPLDGAGCSPTGRVDMEPYSGARRPVVNRVSFDTGNEIRKDKWADSPKHRTWRPLLTKKCRE